MLSYLSPLLLASGAAAQIGMCTVGSVRAPASSGYLNAGAVVKSLVTCPSPALPGGSHDLSIVSPNGDLLSFYSTDGADCATSATEPLQCVRPMPS